MRQADLSRPAPGPLMTLGRDPSPTPGTPVMTERLHIAIGNDFAEMQAAGSRVRDFLVKQGVGGREAYVADFAVEELARSPSREAPHGADHRPAPA